MTGGPGPAVLLPFGLGIPWLRVGQVGRGRVSVSTAAYSRGAGGVLGVFVSQSHRFLLPLRNGPRRRTGPLVSSALCCVSQIVRFLRSEGLWHPCVRWVWQHPFSHSSCSRGVSATLR